MGGVGDLTRSVADGIAGLIGGALAALVDAFWAIVRTGQSILPGPLFPLLLVGLVSFAFLFWAFRR